MTPCAIERLAKGARSITVTTDQLAAIAAASPLGRTGGGDPPLADAIHGDHLIVGANRGDIAHAVRSLSERCGVVARIEGGEVAEQWRKHRRVLRKLHARVLRVGTSPVARP